MEIEQWRGQYVRVTTEQHGARIFERAYVRDGVSVIPINSDGKIRFIREHDWDRQIVRTKLVSGYLADGEVPLACAQRELAEELGLAAQEWELFLRSSSEGIIQKVQYYFVARCLSQGQPHPDDDEQIEGYIDLTPHEVREKALQEQFGTTATAFALLKLVTN